MAKTKKTKIIKRKKTKTTDANKKTTKCHFEVQSIGFLKQNWTITKAKKWLSKHKKRNDKYDMRKNYIFFRQDPPRKFKKECFRTIRVGSKKDILFIISVRKTADKL